MIDMRNWRLLTENVVCKKKEKGKRKKDSGKGIDGLFS